MEGFGLPPVEAMACGTPVLFSTAGSLPEVVGDAGLSFDPLDVEAMTDAITHLLADRPLRDRLATLALARAARYTWARRRPIAPRLLRRARSGARLDLDGSVGLI